MSFLDLLLHASSNAPLLASNPSLDYLRPAAIAFVRDPLASSSFGAHT